MSTRVSPCRRPEISHRARATSPRHRQSAAHPRAGSLGPGGPRRRRTTAMVKQELTRVGRRASDPCARVRPLALTLNANRARAADGRPGCEPGATAVAGVAVGNLRNSAAYSRFDCDGAVRTSGATGCDGRFAPVAARNPRDSAAYGGLDANLSATGATGRFAPCEAQKARNSAGFRPPAATGRCELRTRNFGLSLAKYRAAPPRTRFGPGRTQCPFE